MHWFRNFDWRSFSRHLYIKTIGTDVFGRAAQVAFYFSFAFFPLLLFLVTLFGLILDSTSSLQTELYRYLRQILPSEAYILVRSTMDEIVQNSSGGKLTLGALVTLWSASAGVNSLRSALNSVFEVFDYRSWLFTKLQSLAITFLFIVLLGIALGALAAGTEMFERVLFLIGYQTDSFWLISIIQWTTLTVLLLFVTAVIYSWLPSFKEFRWVWVSPGAILAIILWVGLTGGFRLYLQYFNSYNKAYGSLGAVIILMLWMYLTGLALLIGGAVNSVFMEMSERSTAMEKQMEAPEEVAAEQDNSKVQRRES